MLRKTVRPQRVLARDKPGPKRWWERVAEPLKIGGTLLAAAWTLNLYLDHRQDTRVELTLKYVERFHKDDLAKVRLKLDGYWTSPKGVGVLFTQTDVGLRASGIDRVRKEKLEPEVGMMLEFYSEIALCARTNLCDLETACTYFGDMVQNFYQMYFPLIQLWGLANRADLAEEIQNFPLACKAEPKWKQFWHKISPDRGHPSSP